MLTVASLAGVPSVVGIALVAAGVLVVARRAWALAIAVAVGADVLAWSWLDDLETIGNVVYWGAVVGIGLELLVLARAPDVRRVVVAVAAVCVMPAASAAWSLSPTSTVRQTVTFASVLVVAAFMLVQLRRGHRPVATFAWLAPAVLVASLLALAIVHSQAVAQGGGVSGIVNGPDALGILLALLVPFLLAAPRVGLFATAALLAVVSFFVALSASRTGMVGVLLALLVLELGRRAWARLVAGSAAFVAGAALAILWTPAIPTFGRPISPFASHPAGVPAQAKQLFGERPAGQSLFSSFVGARDEAWREAWRLAAKRPVLGNGFGTGAMLYDHYGSRSRFRFFVGKFAPGTNTHEGYLQELLELGVLGVLLFVVPVLVALVAAALGLRRRWRDADEGAFAAVAVVAAFAALFESILAGAGPLTLVSWLGFAGVSTLVSCSR